MKDKLQLWRYFILSFFILLLASCSSVKKDGPPPYHVDVSKIPNAVPKKERLAKRGNMPFYYVFGQRYRTMKSSKNFSEVGIASWYGTKFHQRRTSSGERYDMLAMTAAHKFLPLPTYLEVTNLQNNRKIIVKVNDRGPFASNRIIDLSYVAAKKLDMLGRGTAKVRIKAIDPIIYNRQILAKNSPPKKTFNPEAITATLNNAWQEAAPAKKVYLHVGDFRNIYAAERFRNHLDAMLITPVRISKTHKPGSTNKYRVRIGPIKDTKTANLITRRLKNIGIKSNKQYGA